MCHRCSNIYIYVIFPFIYISPRFLYLLSIHIKHDAIFLPFITLYSNCISICLMCYFLRSVTIAVIFRGPKHKLVYSLKTYWLNMDKWIGRWKMLGIDFTNTISFKFQFFLVDHSLGRNRSNLININVLLCYLSILLILSLNTFPVIWLWSLDLFTTL